MAAFAALLALGLLPANAARDRMEAGRDALLEGRNALLEGDPETATDAFIRAEDRFIQARGHAGNPLLRVSGWLPILGRTPDAALHLANAGRDVSAAGRLLSEGLAELPGGLASLGPSEGRIPIEAFELFAPSVQAAAGRLRAAEAEVARVETTWLLAPVAAARVQFESEIRPLRRGLEAASLIVTGFPEFMGADEPRRYLFAAENPAELRGTGGLIGSVSVMTADGGRLTFTPFEANEAFPRLPAGTIEPPNEEFGRRYPEAWLHILLANQTPDFPSAGLALQHIYEASRGEELDGVIAADPYALEAMLAVSGPVDHPVLGTVTSENVVELITNRAYSRVAGSTARNQVLGQVTSIALNRFLRGAPPAAAAEAIARAAGEDHLSVLTADEEFQRGIQLARADGALPDAGDAGDVLGVFVNNGGANKVDFYAERTIDYRVTLGDAGITTATAAIENLQRRADIGAAPVRHRTEPGRRCRREHLAAGPVRARGRGAARRRAGRRANQRHRGV